MIESKLITRFKTAADSVLVAQCLARMDSEHLVIIGAGAIAGTIAKAYHAAFPNLRKISIWARRPEQALALAETLGDAGLEISAVTDLPDTLASADMVSTATMATEPVLAGRWIRPGTHVDLIGSFTPDMRETDDELIASTLVYADCIETVVEQTGDIAQPIRSGIITRDHVRGDLYDLVAAPTSSRQSDPQITVFKNGGGAHLDLMIANHVWNQMRTR